MQVLRFLIQMPSHLVVAVALKVTKSLIVNGLKKIIIII
jgi:hypothetical protein